MRNVEWKVKWKRNIEWTRMWLWTHGGMILFAWLPKTSSWTIQLLPPVNISVHHSATTASQPLSTASQPLSTTSQLLSDTIQFLSPVNFCHQSTSTAILPTHHPGLYPQPMPPSTLCPILQLTIQANVHHHWYSLGILAVTLHLCCSSLLVLQALDAQ